MSNLGGLKEIRIVDVSFCYANLKVSLCTCVKDNTCSSQQNVYCNNQRRLEDQLSFTKGFGKVIAPRLMAP